MTESTALLPSGLRDTLPPEAEHEAFVTESLLSRFRQNGYRQVSTPLVEFEASLLTGPGAAMVDKTFRLVDPVSQRTMAVRADITPQIARIAATRLSGWPRPLRLCYNGTVLRVTGDQLRADRQFRQAGLELIGCESVAADAEAITVAVEALTALGVKGLTVDLSLPVLAPALLPALVAGDAVSHDLREALNRKDQASVERLTGTAAPLLAAVMATAGPAAAALKALKALDLPAAAREALAPAEALLPLLAESLPDLEVTLDPVEHRGFEYHSGISFSLFARGLNGELGRGGRYWATAPGHAGETATGATLYLDKVMRALDPPAPTRRLYLPAGTTSADRRARQAEGWWTVIGLEPATDAAHEARRLGCSHVWQDGAAVPLG
ncbi:MAG: ATP phosphoribosyltransferase regulatory subunit [Alphaproteobacteria bacterium]|nr:ATP phosphoribosyltransferase regulatory subunit [Alphaproteobacteria bacterium]MCB9928903.1 ATP phosphoribosyltransferase regulatory subunit [Alphaproteobacteria bacterium]